jgi:hypothetical protein
MDTLSFERNIKWNITLLLLLIIALFLLWMHTNPLRSKLGHVYYKGRKQHVVMIEVKQDSTIFTLNNNVRVSADSVVSAKPRDIFSWITDLRTRYKF